MLSVLRSRSYSHLFGAQILSLIGSGLATVALGLIAYDIAGEHASLVLGAIFAVKMVAYVLVAPVAAAAVARLPKRSVMVGADIIRVGVALLLPWVDQTWQIFVLVFVLQSASATFTPTFQAVIPLVLPDEDDYTSALSLSRLAYDLEAIISPILAAGLLLFLPSRDLFFGTAIGFAASAALVISSLIPKNLGLTDTQDGPVSALGGRARKGIAAFVKSPALRPVLFLNMAVAAAGALVIVATVVIVQSIFGMPERAVPWFLAVSGIGSAVTAILLPRFLKRATERRTMLGGGGLLVISLVIATFALWSGGRTWEPAAIGAAWLLIGVGWSAVATPIGRIIRRESTPENLSLLFAAQFSLSHACWLLTYPLVGALGQVGYGITGIILTLLAATSVGFAKQLWPTPSRKVSV